MAVWGLEASAACRPTRRRGAPVSTMSDWISAVSSELGLDGGADVDLVLLVAADAAHGVTRPAAPVTTYLLGVAVGRGADPAEAAERIRRLVAQEPTHGPTSQ